MEKRIVITGMGAVTPLGIGMENYWQGLMSGKCAIGPIESIDASGLPVKYAAEVKGFVPKEHLAPRLRTDLDRFMQFAYVSAQEAVDDSGLDTDSRRVGIVMGTALAGLSLMGNTQEELAVNHKPVGPRVLSKTMGNIVAAQFAIDHKIKGPSLTVSTACSSGGDAMTVASMLIKAGKADTVLVMGGESAINPVLIHSLSKAGALSKTGRSLPFSKNRDGFVIGEGGGALILETEEHAQSRGAKIYAELLGCANNNDAYHTVSPEPDGAGAAECMRMALTDAGLTPEDIDYINAHGTATHAGDIAETNAIKAVFGDRPVYVSSTKGATGHMMGAGGITETIACIKAINEGMLPPTVNLDEKDEECALNVVANEPLKAETDIAMSNALGFGGQNSCIIVGKYKK